MGVCEGRRLAGWLAALQVIVGSFAGTCTHAAPNETHSYNIAATDIRSGLLQYAQASGLRFLASSDLLSGVMTRGVSGTFDREVAAKILLEGTGLEAVITDSTLSVRRRSPSTATAANPVQGKAPAAKHAPPDPDPVELEQVIVTARRVAEDLQLVPLMVSTLSDEVLEQGGAIRSFGDLGPKVGISMCCGADRITFSGRGKSSTRLRGTINVATYFNSIPVSPSSNIPGLLFDLKNVQVLKGPQGTLFGLASSSGAVLYEPKQPTNELEGYVSTGIGQRDHLELDAVLNIPLFDKKLLLRGGAHVDRSGGFIYDQAQGKYLNDRNNEIFRLSATYRPTDSVENTVLVQKGRTHNNGPVVVAAHSYNPNSIIASALGPITREAFDRQRALGYYTVESVYAGPGGTKFYADNWFVTNTTSWDIGPHAQLRNSLGFTRTVSDAVLPVLALPYPAYGNQAPRFADGTPVPRKPPPADYSYTEELQLILNSPDRRSELIAGAIGYWIPKQGRVNQPVYSTTIVGSSTTAGNARGEDTVYGVFIHGTTDLSQWADGLSISGGYRHSWINARVENRAFDLSNPPALVDYIAGEHDWEIGSYSMSLAYRVSPKTMLYLSNSTGYGAPGFNIAGPGLPDVYRRFEPEELNSIEAGVKTSARFKGAALRLNFAGFYQFYDPVQVIQYVPYQDTVNGQITQATLRRSAAEGRIWGAEATIGLVGGRYELAAALTYLHARYTRYDNGLGADWSSMRFSAVPDATATFALTYHPIRSTSFGDLSLTMDYVWQNSLSMETYPGDPFHDAPANSVLGLTAHWRRILGHRPWEASLYATNLTNTVYQGHIYATAGFIAAGVPVREPRTWGLRLSYRF